MFVCFRSEMYDNSQSWLDKFVRQIQQVQTNNEFQQIIDLLKDKMKSKKAQKLCVLYLSVLMLHN